MGKWSSGLWGQGRRAYTEWFMDAYSKDPHKSRMIKDFGLAYYEEVMKIHQIRLDTNNFNFGPQGVDQWEKLRESMENENYCPQSEDEWTVFFKT